ncbi:MAG: DUF1289 domain-containing protein [Pseudomonas sp.]
MNTEPPVASPCVHICSLDDNDICIGCQRSGAEITDWGRASNERRREILRLCESRARASGAWMNIGTVKG